MPSDVKYKFKDNVRCIKNKHQVRRLPECGVFKREDTDKIEPDIHPHKHDDHKLKQITRGFPIRRSVLAPDKPDINIPQFPSSNDNNYIQNNFNPYDEFYSHDTMFRGIPYRVKPKKLFTQGRFIDENPLLVEQGLYMQNPISSEIVFDNDFFEDNYLNPEGNDNLYDIDDDNEIQFTEEQNKMFYDVIDEFGEVSERDRRLNESDNDKILNAERNKKLMDKGINFEPKSTRGESSKLTKVLKYTQEIQTPKIINDISIDDETTKIIIDEILNTTKKNKFNSPRLDEREKSLLKELFENIGLNESQINLLIENNIKLTAEQKRKLIERLSERHNISSSDIENVINNYNFYDSEFETTLSNLPVKQQNLTRQIALGIRDLANNPEPFETKINDNDIEITEDTVLLDRTGSGFRSRKLTALQKFYKKFNVSETFSASKNILLKGIKNYEKLSQTDQFGEGIDLKDQKMITFKDLQTDRIRPVNEQPNLPEFDITEIQNASANAFQEEALEEIGDRPVRTGKMTYKEQIGSGFRNLGLPQNRPHLAGGTASIIAGFGLGALMHNDKLPPPVNNFIIGGAADSVGRIVTLGTEKLISRGALNITEDGFNIFKSFARGSLEGGIGGIAFGGADMLINQAILNTGATHLTANLVSSNVVGASGFGLALATAPETGGLSIPFSLAVWGIGDLVSVISGKAEDDDEARKIRLANTSNIARTELINSLPKYNYRLDYALHAFKDKDKLDMQNDNWGSFINNLSQVFDTGDSKLNNIGLFGKDETEDSLKFTFDRTLERTESEEGKRILREEYDKNIKRINNDIPRVRQEFRKNYNTRTLYEDYQQQIIDAGNEADKDPNKMLHLKETYKNIDADYEYNRTHINELNENFKNNTKTNKLFAQYVQRLTIEKLCNSEGGCGDLNKQKPPQLSREEIDYLNKQTKNTWLSMAQSQSAISFNQSKFQINNIKVAREYVYNQWTKNKMLPEQLRKQDLVKLAFSDKEFKHSFLQAITLDSQRIIINKYQNEQLKYNNLPPNILNTAFKDGNFKTSINQYYDAMESMSKNLNISISQVVNLQKISDPDKQRNAYQNIQFDSLKQKDEVVENAKKLSEQEDYVRKYHYYDLDEALLNEDPTSIHSWKPKDSQILQAHQTGMNLNQYVQYMHQLALGDEGSFDNIKKYNQDELTKYGLSDFKHFQKELVLAYRNPNMYKYDEKTRQITLNKNPAPFNRDEYMNSFMPERRLRDDTNHIHGQNRDIQHQIDEYNTNLLQYLESKGENYEQMAWNYNEEVFRAGSKKVMASTLDQLYQQERVTIDNNNNNIDNNNNNNDENKTQEDVTTFHNDLMDSIDE